ncbi:amidohydrolase [Novosphingobium endophyticum]|uniref:Amidohydrolase n=1 Tax=Novosphingobium endophyticum TaxID=1955250 RepID=A0A916TUT8_9SPHN|nr:amidohydrolase family protein [Novosphingobium endophyticum]GGC11628.1 amidohydrolase [Novosphingobium endophyticum]
MTEAVPSPADLLIVNGDIVTMNPEREVLVGGAIAVSGDRIVAVGSTSRLRGAYRPAVVVDAAGGVVTPGFINGHQHLTIDTLVGSCVPDAWTSAQAIRDWAIPMGRMHTGDDEELGATLTAVSSALNGVTMVVEAGSVSNPERLARGVAKVGIRATTGLWGSSIKGRPFSGSADEVLAHQCAVLDAFPPGGMVTGWVTLIGHGTADDDLMAGAAALARSRKVGMTMHMSPTNADPELYLERHGRRPIQHLKDIGVLGRHLLIAHGVWLDDSEVDLVLDTGTAIAYCPWAYFRLGQGVSRAGRHAEIFLRGGRISLGCDSANAGDQTDILRQATLAAGLAKDTRIDPSWFGAHEVLEMATIRGAEAVGMAHEIGSIEVGKAADIVIHDNSAMNWSPKGDPVTQLIWGTDGRSVRDVFVAGKAVVQAGKCVTVDVDLLQRAVSEGSLDLLRRSNLTVPYRWPMIPST